MFSVKKIPGRKQILMQVCPLWKRKARKEGWALQVLECGVVLRNLRDSPCTKVISYWSPMSSRNSIAWNPCLLSLWLRGVYGKYSFHVDTEENFRTQTLG
jgi:hypothetical protein